MTSESPENSVHCLTMQPGGDSGLEEDDEIEVLLKGSELEKLMSSLTADVEVFLPHERKTSPAPENRVCDLPFAYSVPTDFIATKELILASGLLLDEDMALLIEDTLEYTRTEHGYISRLQEVLLPCSCALLAFSSYSVMKNATWVAFPSLVLSVGSTLYLSTKVYRSVRLKKTVEKLLAEMTELLSFMKRTAVAIKESYANVNSKVVLSSLRKTNAEVVDRYYSHIESDIAENLKSFTKFLVTIVHITRDATKSVLSILGTSNFSKSFFIASCSDEELGLPSTSTSDCQFADISISKLEELCDQCILMQSEHLRALGMMLSVANESNRKKILHVIDNHLEMVGNSLTMEKQRFSGRLFSKFRQERGCLPLASRDIVLTQLNTSMTSLLCEISCLKEYIHDKAVVVTKDEPYLELSMSNIETEMSECSRLFKQVRSSLGKRTVNEDDLGRVTCVSPSNVFPTGIEVGRTDFSMDSEDRVFLGITDHEENQPSLDCEGEDVNPIYPKFLLNELKGVLEEKRVEFKQRESDAISKSDFIGVEDQFDLVVLNKPLSKSADDITEKVHKSIMKTKENTCCTKSVAWNVPSETTSLLSLDLTKSVAASAAKTSMLWKCSDEEFFGDDDDADDTSTHS